MVLAICGCMVEQPEILKRLMTTFPEVNLYFGTHEIGNLYSLVYSVLTSKERIVSIESKPGEVVESLPACRLNRFKAFVNIIYGCNKFCTYCIVPYTRGKERSRKFDDVIDECKSLVKAGYKEITLLGQNVNAYGKDLDESRDFADLLEAVAKLGIERLRFTTSHPWDFSSKMIDVIAKYPNIMKFIHLPVQSGSNSVLKAMGRRYSREQYLNLVKEMREKIPGLSLSTDIIVGFPKILPTGADKKWDEENAAIGAIGNPKAEEFAKTFAALLQEGAIKENIDTKIQAKESRLNSVKMITRENKEKPQKTMKQ